MMRCPAPTITQRALLAPLLVLLVLLSGRPTQAQQVMDGRPMPGDVFVDPSRGTPPPPEAPPELSAAKRASLVRTAKKLTSDKESSRRKIEDEVIGYGRGAIPALLDDANTTHEGRRDGITRCLTELVDVRDRRLVEESLTSEHVALRRFAAAAAGRLGIERVVDALPDLLDDEDARVRFEASLSLAANGREDGLDQLVTGFDETTRERILAVLPGLSENGRHPQIFARLAIDQERLRLEPEEYNAERRAAVAMLAGIADARSLDGLTTALDDPNSLVQLDAIDALRRLVEQKEPFGASSIFAQIKEVERLKTVMRTRPR